ncbi:MAG: hypothetical protein ACRDMJ_09110 [Solirubrobacteraceae bacterium]
MIVLIALGIHSCAVSASNSALQDYATSASSLISQSNAQGPTLFSGLAQASGASSAVNVQASVNQTLSSASGLLKKAKSQSVPDQMRTANGNLIRVLQMRADGLAKLAHDIQPALGTSTSSSTITAIAGDMAYFYASDVLYKDYVSPEIYAAMSSAGVRFAGLPTTQFLTDLSWLIPTSVATNLKVTAPGLAPAKLAPGAHGHQLNSVSVAGTSLQTGSPNTVSSRSPTFTLSFANSGDNPETNVKCKVSIAGTSISATATVAETLAHHDYTCDVALKNAPAGTQTVDAEVEPVRGETNIINNKLSFPVTFP